MSAQQAAASMNSSYYGGLGPAIVGVVWPLLCIATILVVLRIYTYSAIVKNRGGWSLIWACVAWALGVPSVILYTLAALDGLGNHIEIVAMAPHLTDALLYEWIAACTISFSVGFAKLGAMFYILDVQRRAYRSGRWALFIAVGINFLCYIVTVPLIFVQCNPTPKLWNQLLPGNCDGVNRAYYWAIFTGAWGAATDLLLALYPVVLVYSLQIQLKLKITLCFLMGLGVFTAICSLVKTVQFDRLRATTDATYEIAPLMIWGVTEMWVVLIASSVAPLWPLLRRSASAITQHTGPSILSHLNPARLLSRHRHTHNHSSDSSNPSDKKDTVVQSANFRRLGSQEGRYPANGIEMSKDVGAKHNAVLSGGEKVSPRADFERMYGRAAFGDGSV